MKRAYSKGSTISALSALEGLVAYLRNEVPKQQRQQLNRLEFTITVEQDTGFDDSIPRWKAWMYEDLD